MENILKKSEKTDLDEMIDFIKKLPPEEQQKINSFLQGIKFAQKMQSRRSA